jgi:hypothetical protein
MSNASWMALVLTGVLVAGCGGSNGGSSGALDGVPDAQALTLEVTGGAAEQGAALLAPAAQLAGVAVDPAWPVTGVDLTEGQKKVAGVNAALRAFVLQLETAAVGAGLPTAGGRWFGPKDGCTDADVADLSACPDGATANLRLWVGRRGLALPGSAFVLQARPYGSTDDGAFVTVAAGWMVRGAVVRRGHGQLWLDLDHLRSVANPGDLATGYHGQGKLLAGFAANRVAKAETLLLDGFTPDATNADWPAATVAFRGYKTAAGTARVRVAAIKDYVHTTSDTELGLFHVVYDAALGGRAYGIVSDYTPAGGSKHGDVPTGFYYFGRSCYAAGAPTAPVFKEWFYCPTTEGPAACAADASNPTHVEIGTAWSQCDVAGSPAEFDPPATAPTAAPDPAGAPATMPGESSTGETPDDVPAQDAAPTPS